MTRASTLFQPNTVTGERLNRAGGATFDRSLEQQTVLVLSASTLSDTYYAGKQEIAAETVETLLAMREQDAEFLAKAIVYARNEGFMQLAPVLGLAILGMGTPPGKPISEKDAARLKAFHAIFPKVIRTPDNLREFVTICRSGKLGQTFDGAVRAATRRWLTNLSEHHALKYGSGSSEGITLRDILRMAHPKPASDAVAERFRWLVKGWDDEFTPFTVSAENKQISAYGLLKNYASQNESFALELVEKYRLPWEVVVPTMPKMSAKMWTALIPGMGYMALLRHLNTLNRNGVLAGEVLDEVVTRLTDPEAIRKAKVLPFRFYAASKAIEDVKSPTLIAALDYAMSKSLANVPAIPGTVAIGSDVSGSMSTAMSDKSSVRYVDICAILSATIAHQNQDAYVLPFNSQVLPFNARPSDSLFTYAHAMASLCDNGTAVGAPIQWLLERNIGVDVFIGITDNEDWAYGQWRYWANSSFGGVNPGTRSNFYDLWMQYTQRHPNAKAYLINLAPYRDSVAPSNAKNVKQISGWGEDVLRYIASDVRGVQSQVEAVRQIALYE